MEKCKDILNNESVILRSKELTLSEKKESGWKLAQEEINWWNKRKHGIGGGKPKRKRGDKNSPGNIKPPEKLIRVAEQVVEGSNRASLTN